MPRIIIDFGDRHLPVIGTGDDGVVVVLDGLAVKAYRKQPCPEGRNESPEVRQAKADIARDQATRELRGLQLVKGHPNFPSVVSAGEVDEGSLLIKGERVDVWAVRMELIPNLRSFPSVRYSAGMDADGVRDGAQYEAVAAHLSRQLFDVLLCLHTRGMRHRDLDDVNVSVQVPEMRLIVVDLARADVPGLTCPNELMMIPDAIESVRYVWQRAYMAKGVANRKLTRDGERTDYDVMRRLQARELAMVRASYDEDEPHALFRRRLTYYYMHELWQEPEFIVDYGAFLQERIARLDALKPFHAPALRAAKEAGTDWERYVRLTGVKNDLNPEAPINLSWNAGGCALDDIHAAFARVCEAKGVLQLESSNTYNQVPLSRLSMTAADLQKAIVSMNGLQLLDEALASFREWYCCANGGRDLVFLNAVRACFDLLRVAERFVAEKKKKEEEEDEA